MDMFKNRSIGEYASLIATGLGVIATLVYLIYSVAVNLFVPYIFVLMLIGVVCGAIAFISKNGLLQLLPIIFAALSFALYISERMLMFAHMATHVYGMSERGAILGIVLLIMVLQFIQIVLYCFNCFYEKKD